MMPAFRKFCAWLLIIAGIALLVFVFWARDRYTVPILVYHNVASQRGIYSLNNVSPAAFEWQMKFLKKHHYNVISFNDYVEGVKRGVAFGHNTVLIQFDDGFMDNYTHAFPVLKKYSFAATIFLISDMIGRPPFLTWEQVKEMEKCGIEFGAHTRRHAYLPELNAEEAREEIAGSKKVIEEKIGHPIRFFAYPAGGFTDEVKGLVQEAGFEAAATTNRGRDNFNSDLFELNRIRIKDHENALTLWAKLSGYYNLFRYPRSKNKYEGKENYAVSP